MAELVSLFITRFIHRRYHHEYGDDWMHQTFFQGKAIDTTTKKQSETPSLIYLWLKRFSLAEKELTPVIKAKEGQHTDFTLSLFVACNRQPLQEPLPLQAIFTRPQYKAIKLDMLQDISVLTEYFPRLNVILASKGKAQTWPVYDSLNRAMLAFRTHPMAVGHWMGAIFRNFRIQPLFTHLRFRYTDLYDYETKKYRYPLSERT